MILVIRWFGYASLDLLTVTSPPKSEKPRSGDSHNWGFIEDR
jgi:hypothetical protein